MLEERRHKAFVAQNRFLTDLVLPGGLSLLQREGRILQVCMHNPLDLVFSRSEVDSFQQDLDVPTPNLLKRQKDK